MRGYNDIHSVSGVIFCHLEIFAISDSLAARELYVLGTLFIRWSCALSVSLEEAVSKLYTTYLIKIHIKSTSRPTYLSLFFLFLFWIKTGISEERNAVLPKTWNTSFVMLV